MKLIYCFANNGWCDTCPHARMERTCRNHPYRFFVSRVAEVLEINVESMEDMFGNIGIYFDPNNQHNRRVSKDDLGDLLNEIAGTEAGIKLAVFISKTYSTSY